ncbi:MAG: hypothetical protein RIQ93_3301 [Verrucomicrobiota bacterium]|jgi:hypothetical protein
MNLPKLLCGAFSLFLIAPLFAQWEQSRGTAGLNMQSLLTKGTYNLAGGATGAYVSTDSAASYRSSNSGNDSVGPTRGFADGGAFIFTCTSQGVFRSADNGATWSQKSSGLTDLRTSGIIYAEGNVIVATPSGVFRSANQGDTWQTAGLDQKDVRCVAAIQGVLVAGTNGEGIYRSVDLGQNWAAANTGLNSSNFRAIETKGKTLFAAGGVGSGVFRSTDQGLSWTLLAGGLPSSSYRGFASNSQVIVAGSFGAGVFYSTDNGDTWTAINQGLPDLTIFDLEVNEAYLTVATNTQGVFRLALSNLNLGSALTILTAPANQTLAPGATLTLTAGAWAPGGQPAPSYQWQFNGANVTGATSATLTLSNFQPANAGLYSVIATSGTAVTSDPAVVGVASSSKVIGAGTVVGTNIAHPNGNVFDQVLLTGAAATVTADPQKITRTSFIDRSDDIVQVEFSGAGTLSLVLDNVSGAAAPVNYSQPTVAYMKGHATIVIAGADASTNISVFTVGRATAVDPTGAFNILLPISSTNDPANNGSALFQGHGATAYDGVAGIALIAITSTNGRFGGVRTANASYFATRGVTGIYAPGVTFTGPVYVGDLSAFDAATPMLSLGSAAITQINGGDLFQQNGQPVLVSGITQLNFVAGITSGGVLLPAQANQAQLTQNGTNVTAQLVGHSTRL